MNQQPPNWQPWPPNDPWQQQPFPQQSNTSYPPQQPQNWQQLPPPNGYNSYYPQQPFQPLQPPVNQYQQWQIQGQFTKSYTTPAIITLVLYIFLWIPGLIANIVYLVEANKTRKITGVAPDGYGCLIAMLCVVAAPPVLFMLLVIFIVMAGAASHP